MKEPDEIYHYSPPDGYGDTFFVYAYSGGLLTNGASPNGLSIPILDGDFVCRFWCGLETLATGIQIYDNLLRQCFSAPVSYGAGFAPTGMLVLPERFYPVNNAIRFDLVNVNQTLVGTSGGVSVYASQLLFYGVRRRALHYSDPEGSPYSYYEKPYELGQQTSGVQTSTFVLSINKYGATGGAFTTPDSYQFEIRDYDFELHRVELQLQSAGQTSQFAIMLYDNYGNQVSNVPLLANKFFHLSPSQSSGELNFQPCPPIVYRVGSNLRFDIYSLLMSPTTLPQTFNLLFHGVRRYPCR
jgi:hypothetical protein